MDQVKIPFFKKQRRRVKLLRPHMLLNAQKEKRLRLDFELYITGQKMTGVPEFVSASLTSMELQDSSMHSVDFDQVLEGAICEFFATPSTPSTQKLTAVTLRKFRLARIKEGEDYRIALLFSCTVLSGREMCSWAWEYHGADLWLEVSDAQLKIGGDEEDDGQEELPLEEEDHDAAAKAEVKNMTPAEVASLNSGKKSGKGRPN